MIPDFICHCHYMVTLRIQRINKDCGGMIILAKNFEFKPRVENHICQEDCFPSPVMKLPDAYSNLIRRYCEYQIPDQKQKK